MVLGRQELCSLVISAALHPGAWHAWRAVRPGKPRAWALAGAGVPIRTVGFGNGLASSNYMPFVQLHHLAAEVLLGCPRLNRLYPLELSSSAQPIRPVACARCRNGLLGPKTTLDPNHKPGEHREAGVAHGRG